MGLLSYLSYGLLAAIAFSLFSDATVSALRETSWYFLVVGTVIVGLPLVVVGAVTGLVAERLFGHTPR